MACLGAQREFAYHIPARKRCITTSPATPGAAEALISGVWRAPLSKRSARDPADAGQFVGHPSTDQIPQLSVVEIRLGGLDWRQHPHQGLLRPDLQALLAQDRARTLHDDRYDRHAALGRHPKRAA